MWYSVMVDRLNATQDLLGKEYFVWAGGGGGWGSYQELLLFEPFGQGNPVPLLSIKEAGITGLRFLGDGSHLRFSIQKASAKIKGLVWNRAGEFNDLLSKKSKIDLWGNLEENFFNGITTLQFVVNKFS